MKNIVALLLALISVSSAFCNEPAHVKAIVAAATSTGLLTPRDFSTKILSADELQKLESDIKKQEWIAEIPGLERALVSNFPAAIGEHQKSGFSLSVHYANERIMLLRASVPLVNGNAKEQIETMLAAAEALVGQKAGVREWLDAEWKRSWEISAKLFEKQSGVDHREIVRKKEFGSYLVTVWGVVPDIVFLHCVRIVDKRP